MKSSDCRRFEACDAPLCPLDEQSLECGIWYPGEAICGMRGNWKLPWVKAQKKIAKVGARADRYFNFQMLNRNCIIGRGMEGLDPDKEEGPQLRKWLKAHPSSRRVLTGKQKEIALRNLAKARRQKLGALP